MKEVLDKIRAPIDKGLDRAVTWIVEMAKKAGRFVMQKGKEAAQKLAAWWKLRVATPKVDGEAHHIYFEGEGRAAKLMIASAPMHVRAFIAERRQAKLTAEQKNAANRIEALAKQVDEQEARPDAQGEGIQGEIQRLMNLMAPDVALLLGDGGWGSAENPVAIEYTKRRIGMYPVLYLGPRSESRLPQDDLRGAFQAGAATARTELAKLLTKREQQRWEDAGAPLQIFRPTMQAALPMGGATIGVAAKRAIEVGIRLDYKPGSTQGGGKINDALAPYGYRARAEGNDGDHVVEMQIGGENELYNLWPLPKGENRSSGSLLAKLQVEGPKGGKMTLSEAYKKNKRASFKLLIQKTREA